MARAPWLLLAFLFACGDDRLPSWATGEPPDAYDAAADRPLDGGLLDANLEASTHEG